MDTDVVAGIEAGMETVLVLSGVTKADEVDRFPDRPSRVVDPVASLIAELGEDERLVPAPPTRNS